MADVTKYHGVKPTYPEAKDYLSKVKIGDSYYWLKDYEARAVLDAIYEDYLRSDDKSELLDKISAEESRAKGVEGGLQTAIDALELAVGSSTDAATADGSLFARIKQEIADRAAAITQEVTDRNTAIANAINALDVTDTAVEGEYVSAVNEVDGKISVTRASLPASKVDGVKSGEKILALDSNKELSTTLAIHFDANTRKLQLKGIDDALVSEIDASAFIKDGMLWGEKAFVATDVEETVSITKGSITQSHKFTGLTVGHQYLAFCFTDGAVPTPIYTWESVDLQDLVDVYTAGNGLQFNASDDHKFEVKVDASGKYLSVSASGVKVDGTAIEKYADDVVDAEATLRENADDALDARLDVIEGADTVDGSIKKALKDAKDYTDAETTRATAAEDDLDDKIDGVASDLSDEIDRATEAEEALDDKIDGEISRATAAEGTLTTNLANEVSRAQEEEADIRADFAAADTVLDGKITAEATARAEADTAINTKIGAKTDEATADTVYGAIAAEKARAEAAEDALDDKIDALGENAFKDVTYASLTLNKKIGETVTVVHTFGDLADKNLAKLEVKGQTISGVKATGTSTGELTGALGYASTQLASSGVFTAEGTIDVTLSGNTFNAITSIGTLPSYTDGSLSGGKATVVDTTKFNGGTQANFTQGSKATLTTSNINYVEEGIKVSVDETDAECLVFSAITAKTAKAVDTFTANGDDTFVKNTVASLGDGFVTAGSDVSYTAPVYVPGTLPAMATQTVAVASKSFTGTANQPISVAGNYDKANLGTVAFNGKSITLDVGDIVVADKSVTEKA